MSHATLQSPTLRPQCAGVPPPFRARPFGPARVLPPPYVGLGAVLAPCSAASQRVTFDALSVTAACARACARPPARAVGEAVEMTSSRSRVKSEAHPTRDVARVAQTRATVVQRSARRNVNRQARVCRRLHGSSALAARTPGSQLANSRPTHAVELPGMLPALQRILRGAVTARARCRHREALDRN
jgi:hypothetical protein